MSNVLNTSVVAAECVVVAVTNKIFGADGVPTRARLVFAFAVGTRAIGTLGPVFVDTVYRTLGDIDLGVGNSTSAIFAIEIVRNAERSVLHLCDARDLSVEENVAIARRIVLGEWNRWIKDLGHSHRGMLIITGGSRSGNGCEGKSRERKLHLDVWYLVLFEMEMTNCFGMMVSAPRVFGFMCSTRASDR